MIDPRLAWFAIGASCSAVMFGWPWHPRFSRYTRMQDPDWRRSINHENINRPSGPPPLKLRRSEPDPLCGSNEITLQEWEAMRTPPPIRLDEGRVQRGNGSGGPTTQKPRIIPRGTRSISYPDPGPDRQPTNPFTGKPVEPHD